MDGLLNYLGNLNSLTVAICTFLVILALRFFLQSSPDSSGRAPLPPGPAGVPLLGVLPWLVLNKPHLLFTRWAERYGDVVSFMVGSQRFVLLNSADAVREAFVKNAHSTADRPKSFLTSVICKDKGIGATSGQTWKEQRRFSLTTLRDFGMGKIRLEENILDEVRALIKVIEDKNGDPFDPQFLIMTSVCNVIFAIVHGRRFDHDDPPSGHTTSSRRLFLVDFWLIC